MISIYTKMVLTALKILSDIYFMVISSASDEEIQDSAIRYFFEYFNALLSNSSNKLARNAAIFPFVIQSLLYRITLKKPSLKKIIKLHKNNNKAYC